MDARLNPHFEALLEQLGREAGQPMQRSAAHAFELLLPDNLPVRVSVHADGDRLVLELYLDALALLSGVVRTTVIRTALLLNHVGLRGRRFALGLDGRDYLMLIGWLPLQADSAERLIDELHYLAAQALQVRALVQQLTQPDPDALLTPVSATTP